MQTVTFSKTEIKTNAEPFAGLGNRLKQYLEEFTPLINGYTDLEGNTTAPWNRSKMVGAIAIVDCILENLITQNGLATYRIKDLCQNIHTEILEHIHESRFECTAAIEGIQKRLLINKEHGSGGCTSKSFIQGILKDLEDLGLVERAWREYKGPVFDEKGQPHWEPPATFINCDVPGLCMFVWILLQTYQARAIELEDNKTSIDKDIRNNAKRAPEINLPDHHHFWAQKMVEAILGISINAKIEDLAEANPGPERSKSILWSKLMRLGDRLRYLEAGAQQAIELGVAVSREVEYGIVWIKTVLRRYEKVLPGFV
jgi:hypothetical protein